MCGGSDDSGGTVPSTLRIGSSGLPVSRRPAAGCSLEPLIDGAQALPRLAAELRKARSQVHLAGWFMSPDFAPVREPVRVELRTLLAELAERVPVRVLLWAGSPLSLCRPDRQDVAADERSDQ